MIVVTIVILVVYAAVFVLDQIFMAKPKASFDFCCLESADGILDIRWITVILMGAGYITYIAELAFDAYNAPFWMQPVGALISIFGLVVYYIALSARYYAWWSHKLTAERSVIVTDGIFSISRNPELLAYTFISIGLTLLCFDIVTLIITVLSIIAAYWSAWENEEYKRFLNRKEYRAYADRVHMIIGKVTYPLTSIYDDEEHEDEDTDEDAVEDTNPETGDESSDTDSQDDKEGASRNVRVPFFILDDDKDAADESTDTDSEG